MTRFLVEPGECHQFLSFLERLVRSDLTTGVPKTLWLNRFKECVDLWDILKTLMIQAGLVKCLLDAGMLDAPGAGMLSLPFSALSRQTQGPISEE